MPDMQEITDRLQRALDLNSQGSSSASNVLGQTQNGLSQKQKDDVRAIVASFFQQESSEEGGDQPVTHVNVKELDSIPDVIKSLREFSGRPGEFSSWRKSVDRILELFESIRGTSRYFAILHTIRSKVVGEADTALESYRTPLDWGRMKKCLMMHYSDRRDIGTLEYQMTTLWQGNMSVTEFYRAVYQHLSLILDKIACLDYDDRSLINMTNAYRDKALDTFIRGLRGEMPRLLAISAPNSLPQALHICLKLENMNYRTHHAQGQNRGTNANKSISNQGNGMVHRSGVFPELVYFGGPTRPPVPPRTQKHVFHPNSQGLDHNRQQFRHDIGQNRPQFNQISQQAPQFVQNYPVSNSQPLQRAEPMDVDRSMQSRTINYMNRPPFNNSTHKRTAGGSFQVPTNKIQRNFHLETGGTSDLRNHQADNTIYAADPEPPMEAVGGPPDITEYNEIINREEVGEVLNPFDYGHEVNGQTDDYTAQELNSDLNFFG